MKLKENSWDKIFEQEIEEIKKNFLLKLEEGALQEIEGMVEEVLQGFLETGNVKNLSYLIDFFSSWSFLKKTLIFFKLSRDFLEGQVKRETLKEVRKTYLGDRSITGYEDFLKSFQDFFSEEPDFLKHEIEFCQYVASILHRERAKRLGAEIEKKGMDKQRFLQELILFHDEPWTLNYLFLDRYFLGEKEEAKMLYDYILSNQYFLHSKVRSWSLKEGFEKERNYRTEKELDKEHERNPSREKLTEREIGKLLKNISGEVLEKDRKKLMDAYTRAEALVEETSVFKISGFQDIKDKIYFHIGNQSYGKALEILESQKSENEDFLYLYTLTLFLRKDYEKLTTYLKSLEKRSMIGLDAYYLWAESYYALGKFSKAKKLYLKVDKMSEDYRLTRMRLNRLEEIK